MPIVYDATNDCFFLQGSGGGNPEATVTFLNFIMPNVDYSAPQTMPTLTDSAMAVATTAQNGDAWVIYGRDTGTTYVNSINPNTNTRTNRTAFGAIMHRARGIDLSNNGDIWFAAGSSSTPRVASYSPSGTQTIRTALSVNRNVAMAVRAGLVGETGDYFVAGGNAYVGGISNTAESYSASGTLTARTNLSAARLDGIGKRGINNNAWFIGGKTSISTGSPNGTIDIYAISGTRTAGTAINPARSFLNAAQNAAGHILIGGGHPATGVSDVVEKYTAATTKTTLTPLSIARSRTEAFSDGMGRVWFAGGKSSEGSSSYSFFTQIDIYHNTDTRTIKNMLTSRSMFGATADGLQNIWFLGGGEFENALLFRAEVEKWTSESAIPAPSGTKYSFNGQPEQTSTGNIIQAPMGINTGYIIYKTGTIQG